MAESKCPPLGTGSVDLSALSAALAKNNADPAKAIAAATTNTRADKLEAEAKAKAKAAPAPTGDAA